MSIWTLFTSSGVNQNIYLPYLYFYTNHASFNVVTSRVPWETRPCFIHSYSIYYTINHFHFVTAVSWEFLRSIKAFKSFLQLRYSRSVQHTCSSENTRTKPSWTFTSNPGASDYHLGSEKAIITTNISFIPTLLQLIERECTTLPSKNCGAWYRDVQIPFTQRKGISTAARSISNIRLGVLVAIRLKGLGPYHPVYQLHWHAHPAKTPIGDLSRMITLSSRPARRNIALSCIPQVDLVRLSIESWTIGSFYEYRRDWIHLLLGGTIRLRLRLDFQHVKIKLSLRGRIYEYGSPYQGHGTYPSVLAVGWNIVA